MKLSELGHPDLRSNVSHRFWAKVEKGGDDDCWPWMSKARHKFGYGMLTVRAGLVAYSHWIAWSLDNGPIPNGRYICHTCDNPGCCNPRHLYLGSAQQNVADIHARKRRLYCPHTQESRTRIADGRAKNPPQLTDDGRKAQSEAMRKRWQDPEWRKSFAAQMSGVKNHRFGKRPPDHQIEAVKRAHRKGFNHTEETKQKMRESALRRGAKAP